MSNTPPVGPTAASVLEITLADAAWITPGDGSVSTLLYLSDGVTYARSARYEPIIVDWSSIRRGFDVKASNLSRLETTVTVDDENGHVRDALENGQQRGSPAVIWSVYPGDATNFQRIFTGVLERWGYRKGETDLVLRTDDLALRNYLPGWPVSKSEWPNAPTSSIGLLVPLLYGTHNSSGLSGTGMLPTIPVDWTASVIGWYAVCAGEAKEILAVYVDGTAKTITTHYTVDYALTRAGRTYTVLKFTAGNIPSATAVVTCDARGYEATGNTGSGTTAPTGVQITNPVSQMRHQLVNFAENEWLTGAWITPEASTLIDQESWADVVQWADEHQLEGTNYVGGTAESMQAWDVFNRWLDCWGFRAWWTAEGRIGLAVIDLAWPGYRSTSDPALLRKEHELETSASYDMVTENLTGEITASYLYDEVQQKNLASLTVIDPDAPEAVTSSVDMRNSVRRAV